MPKRLKYRIEFEEGYPKAVLDFISETQSGKYTDDIPQIANIEIKRLQIQEQDSFVEDESILFGLS